MAMNKTFINFALLGLFVLAFISFNVITQENNGVEDGILNNAIINKTYVALDANLSDFQTKAESQDEKQEKENPTAQDGSLIFFSIKSTGGVIKGMIFGVYNAIILIPAGILGIPEVVAIVITAILGIILVLSAWRLYKAGE